MTEQVLIVDDDALHSNMLATLLRRKLAYESTKAGNGREALNLLEKDSQQNILLVILDLNMPVMGGMETLEIIRQKYPALPVIMLTGTQDSEQAVQAMKLGASDFITKPYEGERLAVTVRNALKLSGLSREVRRLSRKEEGRLTFDTLIGNDQGLLAAVNVGRKAASSDIPVLICGETGTGKEVFAQTIHGESQRSGKPFIAVNCGAIPTQLVESVLFGHEKGAFTGATEKTLGKFREADGGTVFLDEVGELPLDAQVKLLRVLQQKEVEPVGSARSVPVNVRIISATNRNLAHDVKTGRFREDLYFRLNVLEIALPPLRERKSDILSLAQHFLEREAVKHASPPKHFSKEAKALLSNYNWPGNVRELENKVRRANLLCDETEITNAALFDGTDFKNKNAQPSEALRKGMMTIDLINLEGLIKKADEIEREMIAKTMNYTGQNITETSRLLGIAKSTLYRKLTDKN
ncbi:MAG: sigma-54-dependent Fis family transcriptional regulator [Alphaproteobacteria bacterium]|jgi:DNA-binding NtrC family response regulator|nr:sigma-54-dependent Fis family transcriptional regulator [Alphaproteobacteria bacterium]QQS56349.1 MAG: sigma-54-dependent Fis family transcriptional regulator [Alphaproteobacteria bacterium]